MWMAPLLWGCGPTPLPETGPPAETGGIDTDPDTDTPNPPRREWVEVSTYPCARDSDGWVECWHSRQWNPLGTPDSRYEPVPDSPVPMSLFYAPESGAVSGVERDSGRSNNWYCGSCEGGQVSATCSPAQCVPANFTDPVQLGWHCGLERSGQVRCFNEFRFLNGDIVTHADVTDLPTLLYPDGRLVSHQYFDILSVDEILPRADEVIDLAKANTGACVLYQDGTIDCFGGAGPPGTDPTELFTSPPYRDLEGGVWSACATREDWTIECNDGTVLDFGPYRDIAVSTQSRSSPSVENGLAVCVITVDNAVRCHGTRYDYEDLQEKLPKGDSAAGKP